MYIMHNLKRHNFFCALMNSSDAHMLWIPILGGYMYLSLS